MTLVLLIAGLVLLVAGAEVMVRGASRLALALGISPVIVGLTVVAMGTSAPELAVGIKAAFTDQGDLVMGNAVGSNIMNVLVILGLPALILPMLVAQRLIRIDVPVMIGVSLLLVVLAANGVLGRLEGLLLSGGLAGYIAFTLYASRRDSGPVVQEYVHEFGERDHGAGANLRNLGMVAGGVVMLVLGSEWLVDGATRIATQLGLSKLIIGLTIVAIGTSLPELATSLVAAARGERDIAVGNVVGSNIFNILAVLGIAALVSPNAIQVPQAAISFDLPVMLAVAIACLPVFFNGLIERWQGALFFAYYLAYLVYVVLNASEHDALGTYSTVMLLFALPFTLVVLGVSFLRDLRAHQAARRA